MEQFEVNKPVDAVAVYCGSEQPEPEAILPIFFGAFVFWFAYLVAATTAAVGVVAGGVAAVAAAIGYEVEVGGPDSI